VTAIFTLAVRLYPHHEYRKAIKLHSDLPFSLVGNKKQSERGGGTKHAGGGVGENILNAVLKEESTMQEPRKNKYFTVYGHRKVFFF
jgi:hypothetical protein